MRRGDNLAAFDRMLPSPGKWIEGMGGRGADIGTDRASRLLVDSDTGRNSVVVLVVSVLGFFKSLLWAGSLELGRELLPLEPAVLPLLCGRSWPGMAATCVLLLPLLPGRADCAGRGGRDPLPGRLLLRLGDCVGTCLNGLLAAWWDAGKAATGRVD